METKLKIYKSPEKIAEKLSKDLSDVLIGTEEKLAIALSGGNTPKIWFQTLAREPFKNSIQWDNIKIFWVDERCVPPDNSGSNYGVAKKILLDNISIPEENIHRIKGEFDPILEAERYAIEIFKNVRKNKNGLPIFDWTILGLGEDGHTASLFPGKKLNNVVKNICGIAIHPESGQKRISLTEKVINNSNRVSFIVTGRKKAKVLSEIIKNTPGSKKFPASKINPENGVLEWIVDKESASLL